ncbi:hypothetical protein [Magnetovibrio sp.]|uniref:hypothetical protein n=1 Tax=Magnetovibrio sp. TaxID=2024836 RepID=UPI002F94CF6B
MRPSGVFNLLILSALGLGLAACATPTKIAVVPDQPSPEGRLTVMGSLRNFSLDAPPADWIISGGGSAQSSSSLSTVMRDGVPALELKSGLERIIAVRQVDAMMLATPFLSWNWHLSNHGEGIHPIRLIVGFHGGAAAPNVERASQGLGLPPHDRALALVWGDTALRRGSLSLPPADKPYVAPIYTVRGGRENTRKWWLEHIDLSELYAKAWPNDDRTYTRIAFIGLASAPTSMPVRGRISGILLTH